MKIPKTSLPEITVEAPPAKAYTLRAIILSGLAVGTSTIHNPLLAADQLAVLDALEKLGIEITRNPGVLQIRGGGGKFSPREKTLDLNESGVGMNFLMSIASFTGKPVILTGKQGLLSRPVGELASGLRQLGCHLEFLEREGFPPLRNPGKGLTGGLVKMSGAKNSQYFSSIAISAPYAAQEVTLHCLDDMTEKPYFDISLEMMEKFGVAASRNGYTQTIIPNTTGYQAAEIQVEGDYSSASYFFIAAAICRNTVHVTGLNPASLQGDKKMLDILEAMGCKIERNSDRITVTGQALSGVEVEMADIPDLVPSVAVAAAFAEGTTCITKVGHLRFKECNRLEAIVTNLTRMGVTAHYDADALYIEGNHRVKGGEMNTYNDHRIAMSFAVAGLACGDVVIEDEKCVAKSFPDFWIRLQNFYKKD